MCLSMLLRSGLPTEFWWDAYEAATYITIKLPTKIVQGYMTPYECVHGEIPDLSHLRIWRCKTYLKIAEPGKIFGIKLSLTKVQLDIRSLCLNLKK